MFWFLDQDLTGRRISTGDARGKGEGEDEGKERHDMWWILDLSTLLLHIFVLL